MLVDLGVLREWPYYSGVVFEAYEVPGEKSAEGAITITVVNLAADPVTCDLPEVGQPGVDPDGFVEVLSVG